MVPIFKRGQVDLENYTVDQSGWHQYLVNTVCGKDNEEAYLTAPRNEQSDY